MKEKNFFWSMLGIMTVAMLNVCFVSCGDDENANANQKSGVCGPSLEWRYDGSTHELSIFGTGEMTNYYNTNSTPWHDLQIQSVIINDGITTVGQNAFSECTYLTKVKFPSSLKEIKQYAFSQSGLISIDVPSSTTVIKEFAFHGCSNLQSATFASAAKLESIEKSAFKGTSLETITFPSSLKTIGESAFMSTSKLSSISFSTTGLLETIEDNAFSESGLNGVTLSFDMPNLKKIGHRAFAGCTVKKVVFGKSLTFVGAHAFEGVSDDVVIPDYSMILFNDRSITGSFKVVRIGYYSPQSSMGALYAFESTATSGKVYVNCALPPISYKFSDVFGNNVSGWTLYVPKGCKEQYAFCGFNTVVESSSLDNGNSCFQVTIPGTVGNAIDLGLSVKWADRNVGATAIGDYGGLYGWGDGSGGRKSEDENEYFSTYDEYSVCGSIRDIAAVKWGGKWRLPTEEEMIELKNKCTTESATINGIKGVRLIGPNGNSIFLPAAGYRVGEEISERGDYGAYYNGSSRDRQNYSDDLYFYYGESNIYLYRCSWHKLYYGQSIRPVTD